MKEHSVLHHLGELRKRFIFSFIFFIASFFVSYFFAENIFNVLAKPLGDSKMIFTSLTEGFFTYLKLSFFMALFVSIPFILTQSWLYIKPALYEKEQKLIFPFFFMMPLLFIIGSLFVYFFVIPNAWNFFLSFQSEKIELAAKISEYLNLVTSLIIAFGLCFQLPLILMILSKLKIINYNMLKKFRKYFIVLAFICGAFLTPPDVVSQLFLAFVIMFLFEISVILIRISSD